MERVALHLKFCGQKIGKKKIISEPSCTFPIHYYFWISPDLFFFLSFFFSPCARFQKLCGGWLIRAVTIVHLQYVIKLKNVIDHFG